MEPDRCDHLFVQPGSFDASLTVYRDALGWKVLFDCGGDGERLVTIDTSLRR